MYKVFSSSDVDKFLLEEEKQQLERIENKLKECNGDSKGYKVIDLKESYAPYILAKLELYASSLPELYNRLELVINNDSDVELVASIIADINEFTIVNAHKIKAAELREYNEKISKLGEKFIV